MLQFGLTLLTSLYLLQISKYIDLPRTNLTHHELASMVVMLTSTQHMDKPLLVTDLKIHRLAPHKPDSS